MVISINCDYMFNSNKFETEKVKKGFYYYKLTHSNGSPFSSTQRDSIFETIIPIFETRNLSD